MFGPRGFRIRKGGTSYREEVIVPLAGSYTIGYTIPVKTAISLPDSLFEQAERLAKRLGISRSELYQRAITAFIHQRSRDVVREALNRVYDTTSSRELDPLIRAASEQTLIDEEW
jgi:hypothetical protein